MTGHLVADVNVISFIVIKMFIQTKHNYIVGNSYEVGKYIKVKINFDALDKAS